MKSTAGRPSISSMRPYAERVTTPVGPTGRSPVPTATENASGPDRRSRARPCSRTWSSQTWYDGFGAPRVTPLDAATDEDDALGQRCADRLQGQLAIEGIGDHEAQARRLSVAASTSPTARRPPPRPRPAARSRPRW